MQYTTLLVRTNFTATKFITNNYGEVCKLNALTTELEGVVGVGYMTENWDTVPVIPIRAIPHLIRAF